MAIESTCCFSFVHTVEGHGVDPHVVDDVVVASEESKFAAPSMAGLQSDQEKEKRELDKAAFDS